MRYNESVDVSRSVQLLYKDDHVSVTVCYFQSFLHFLYPPLCAAMAVKMLSWGRS